MVPGGVQRDDGLGSAAVYAMVLHGTNLYVGGSFTRAGDVAANSVAKWDGQRWSSLGEGVLGIWPSHVSPEIGVVRSMAIVGDSLYVGGQFTHAGGKPSPSFARWRLTD